jgi:hypothetical protein
MPTSILDKYGATTAATITLASLANNAGRISAQIDNTTTRAPMLIVYYRFKSAATPTAGNPVTLYLIRGDTSGTAHVDENLGTADAAVSTKPNHADIVHITPAKATASWDSGGASAVILNPGPKFSLALFNESGQAFTSTAGDHYVRYVLVNPESQ